MSTSVEGRSVLITGGGSGIGEGAARYLASRGARVTISGRRADRIREVAQSIGPLCNWVEGDVCVASDRQRMLEAALAHGQGTLFGLINNAGITRDTLVLRMK